MVVAERIVGHVHPLLAALRDNPADEAAFWAKIDRGRAPLVEQDLVTPAHSIVTFVFPAPPKARHVVVQPGFGQPLDNVMDQIAETNVCHASYRYRNDVRTSYSFRPDLPLIDWNEADENQRKELAAFPAQPDPNHREHFVSRAGDGLPDNVHSFVSLPDAPDESLALKRPGIARGWIDKHVFRSQIMGNERNIWVYSPPGYASAGRSYPVLLAFDGGQALSQIPVQRLLDNLLADRKIVPVVAVFVDNPTPTSRNDELPCNEDFARFIALELLPWLRGCYRLSHDPQDHYVTGASYGGLASMWLALRLPHVFGNVISQAASLWWGPGFDMNTPQSLQNYTPGWLIEQYDRSPRLPVRFWMEIGLMEHPERMLEPNRRMKALLEAKGYDLTYSEPAGGHDAALWRGTLGEALADVLRPAA